MWFKKTPDPKPSFPIGSYTLNMMLAEGPPFREFSPGEYEVMGRQFVGENIYHAPDVEFVGKPWNLTLGIVQGRLYKIAPFLELGDKTEANEVAFRALTFCTERLGKPAEQRTGFFVWDTTDGNVILQTAECKDGFAVNLFLTARCASEFTRLA